MDTLKVYRYDPYHLGAVTVFSSHDCQGYSGRVYADPRFGFKHMLTQWDMWKNNIGDGWARSIYIPHGISVDLYDGSGFDGEMTTLHG